jgi:phosphoglycerate dehydrogenase-like enzyme
MTHVAILDDYQNVALKLADWSALAGRVEPVSFTRPFESMDAATEALDGYPVVVAMRERTPFPAEMFDRLPDLELLITTGMRNAAIDMAAAKERGVMVCGTNLLPYPAAELTWGLILAHSLNIPRDAQSMASGGWQVGFGRSLNGKTIGIIGLGKQGSQVARFANAFGMKLLAWSRSLTPEQAAEHGATRAEFDDLLSQSDIVTIHIPLNEGSRGLIGTREFGLMKQSALLVNTSRGPIVEESALIDAVREGRIGGAAIDVYDKEPLPAEHPLRGLRNTLLTPHTGYVTRENLSLMYTQAVEGIGAWLDGAPVRVLNE